MILFRAFCVALAFVRHTSDTQIPALCAGLLTLMVDGSRQIVLSLDRYLVGIRKKK